MDDDSNELLFGDCTIGDLIDETCASNGTDPFDGIESLRSDTALDGLCSLLATEWLKLGDAQHTVARMFCPENRLRVLVLLGRVLNAGTWFDVSLGGAGMFRLKRRYKDGAAAAADVAQALSSDLLSVLHEDAVTLPALTQLMDRYCDRHNEQHDRLSSTAVLLPRVGGSVDVRALAPVVQARGCTVQLLLAGNTDDDTTGAEASPLLPTCDAAIAALTDAVAHIVPSGTPFTPLAFQSSLQRMCSRAVSVQRSYMLATVQPARSLFPPPQDRSAPFEVTVPPDEAPAPACLGHISAHTDPMTGCTVLQFATRQAARAAAAWFCLRGGFATVKTA